MLFTANISKTSSLSFQFIQSLVLMMRFNLQSLCQKLKIAQAGALLCCVTVTW
jgi:hypothetical protein